MNSIHYINSELLQDEVIVAYILSNLEYEYYWSDDFSPTFYIQLAKLGFISVLDIHKGNEILVPQIQANYALLKFENLHISKNTKKLLNTKKLEIVIDDNIAEIGSLINKSYKDCWMSKKYIKTLEATKELYKDFEVKTVYIIEDNSIVAGEIGYFINKSYTSLSGFTNRDKKYQNYGSAQLVLLAQYLKKNDFTFWNLGQPYMDYKIKLGAKILPRKEFLLIWLEEMNFAIK